MTRLTCLGGGTGLFSLLSGLKETCPTAHLSAIVSMADSGGSTGRLRDEYGHLPAGDVRRCLVALSHAPLQLRQLMEYRFGKGTLQGHSFGNLWLTALKEIIEGSREEKEYHAIKIMEEILHIKDSVYPVTLTNTHLCAELQDGTIVRGETNIDIPKRQRAPIQRVYLDPEAILFEEAARAIGRADAIIIGPGDLYTSIMPNLIVKGVPEAISTAREHGTKIVFIVNTMTKHGETDGYTATDFVETIQTVLQTNLDHIICNTGAISEAQQASYEREHSFPVKDDLSGENIVRADLVGDADYARHNPKRLATVLHDLLEVN